MPTLLHRTLAATTLVGLSLLTASAAADPGNAWHVPQNAEPGIASMRTPVYPGDAGSAVTVWSGNQSQGAGGNPGNQLEDGSAVIHRRIGSAGWTEAALTFQSSAGNNVFYSAPISGGTYSPGDNVEYYLRIPYSDHDTTFVSGSDGQSAAGILESDAQADPYRVAMPWPLVPGADPTLHTFDGFEAGWFEDSGHIAIVVRRGDDPLVLAPPRVNIDDEWLQVGAVVDASQVGDAYELTQTLADRLITARLSSPSEGVIRYEVTDWDGPAPALTSISAASAATEHFFGLGEKFNGFDQAGNTVRIVTSDPAGDKGDRSYKSAPWFVSNAGYGFHLDSSAPSEFDLRDTQSDRYTVTNEFGALAINIVVGPDLPDVITRYTAYTGRPPLPPPWAFAPWMSSDHWRDGGEVRYVASRLVAEGIPGSVFVFDSPWETAYNDFTWNETQFGAGGNYGGRDYDGFASANEMLEFLRAHGFKVVIWLTPFVNTSSVQEGVPGQNTGEAANYAEAAAAGYFVSDGDGGPPLLVDWWKGTGSPVDFTNPAARGWFNSQLEALVDDSDDVIGGFKIDDGEGAFIPPNASYFDGRTGVLMANAYTVEYHETVGQILGDQGILFSRSGFTGTHAWPGCWAGDNEPNFGDANGLPSVMVAGQSAAMSGYAIWGHDIGGYQDNNLSSTPENLFMRWAQFGAFSPLMQMHRQVPLGLQYPWSFGDEGLANYRTYAALHTELFPYIYSYAAIAAQTGLPILRPLVLHSQDDENTWGVRHTFLFGESLLVAPMVTNEQTDRTLYLPEGEWLDYWSHEAYDGGQLIDWSNDDQSIVPVFVRRGSIVPKLTEVPQTLLLQSYVGNEDISSPTDAWTLECFPSAVVVNFQAFEGTSMTLVEDGDITLGIDGPARTYVAQVLAEEPLAVTYAGDPLDDWSVEGDTIVANFDHAGGAADLVLHYSPIGGDTTTTGNLDTGEEGTPDDDGETGPSTAGDDGGSTSGASSGENDDDGGGCGCGPPRGAPPGWLLLAFVGLAATRRRARWERS